MGIFPNEYESREMGHGAGLGAWLSIQIYFSKHPGPREEKVMPLKLSVVAMDEEFESGGLQALESFLDRTLGIAFDQVKREITQPYREAMHKRGDARFGVLTPFLEMGPIGHDVIKKIALEDHEKRKKEGK